MHAQGAEIIQQIGPVLEQAGVPLTTQQAEQLQTIVPGADVQQQIIAVLSQQQLQVLQQASQNAGPSMPQILAQAGSPLTQEQISKLSAIQPGPDAQQQMMSILTEQQTAILQQFIQQQQAQGPNMMNVLEQAGAPLTEEQISKLSAIQPGPDAQQQMIEILTKEQIQILQQTGPQ